MSELKQQLLELYARGTTDTVHKLEQYQELCNRYNNDRAFHGERKQMETLRDNVDNFIRNRDSYKDQVEFALRLLRKLKVAEDQLLSRDLILMSYGQKWETAKREYFEKKSKVVINAQHYFLSFTNRNPGFPNINQVNRNHRFFIIDTLGQKAYDDADLSKRNLLAESINHLLRNKQLDGFYYPEHEENNEKVEEKLQYNCLSSLSLVQLVQGEMFRYYQNSRNWCYYEYKVVQELDANRILFVQVDEEIPSEDIYINFDPWFKAFTQKDTVKLIQTPWHKPEDIDQNYKKVTERLTANIKKTMDRIYLEIPN